MTDIKKQFQKLIKNIIQIQSKEDEELQEIELKSKLISFLNIFYNHISVSIITNINQLNYITKDFLSDEDDEDSEDNHSSHDFNFESLLKKTNQENLSSNGIDNDNDEEDYNCTTEDESEDGNNTEEEDENESEDGNNTEEDESEDGNNTEEEDTNVKSIENEIKIALENNQFCLARVHPKNTTYFHKTNSEDAVYSYRLAGHCFGKQCSRKKKNGDLCTLHTTNQKLQLITERPKEIPDEAKVSDIWVHEPDPYDLSGRLNLSTVIHREKEYQVCKESGEVFKDGVLVGKYSNQEVTLYKKKNGSN